MTSIGAMFRPESALGLALLRMVVPAIVLVSPELWLAPRWAAWPRALRTAPELLSEVLWLLPQTPAEAQRAQWLLVAACVTTALGLCSRLSAALLTVFGLRVFALSQLGGAVMHDMHLFWFSAVLAVSPCGEALSLDRAWRLRQTPASTTSLGAAVGLQAVRALLGVIYFFPGYWKLHSSGLGWIFSDNLRNQMYLKWFQHGFVPPVRVDRWPGLLHAGALGVVVFELSFFLLALLPRTRLLALAGGLFFHAAALVFMRIPFMSLWACYVVLIDWDALLARVRRRRPAPSRRAERWPLPTLGVAALLLSASVVQGARGAMQAWPFACYPTFQWMVDAVIPDLRIEAQHADGSVHVLPDGPATGAARSQAGWAMAWRLAGHYGQPASDAQLRLYLEQLCREPKHCEGIADAATLRFFAAHYSALPERLGDPPLDKALLGTLHPPFATP